MIPNASRDRIYGVVRPADNPNTSLRLHASGSPPQEFGTLLGGTESGGGDASLQAVSTFAKKIEPILEQDRFLPIANIARIMKKVIPAEGKLSKESKECMQECVTEFILFITSEASERCSIERRKTITGEDLVQAFSTLGFDDYVEPLRDFLRKYREANKIHGLKADELPTTGLDKLCSINPSTSTPQSTSSSQNQQRLDDAIDLTPALKRSRNLHSTGEGQSLTAKCAGPSTAAGEGNSQTLPPTLQSMPVFIDVATNQYYITVQGPDGTQSLLPVTLSTATNNSSSSRESGMDGGAQVARSTPARRHVEDAEQTVRHYLQSKNTTRSKKMGS